MGRISDLEKRVEELLAANARLALLNEQATANASTPVSEESFLDWFKSQNTEAQQSLLDRIGNQVPLNEERVREWLASNPDSRDKIFARIGANNEIVFKYLQQHPEVWEAWTAKEDQLRDLAKMLPKAVVLHFLRYVAELLDRREYEDALKKQPQGPADQSHKKTGPRDLLNRIFGRMGG
jgi:hypothetical protein